jgi:hypothetical protein
MGTKTITSNRPILIQIRTYTTPELIPRRRCQCRKRTWRSRIFSVTSRFPKMCFVVQRKSLLNGKCRALPLLPSTRRLHLVCNKPGFFPILRHSSRLVTMYFFFSPRSDSARLLLNFGHALPSLFDTRTCILYHLHLIAKDQRSTGIAPTMYTTNHTLNRPPQHTLSASYCIYPDLVSSHLCYASFDILHIPHHTYLSYHPSYACHSSNWPGHKGSSL